MFWFILWGPEVIWTSFQMYTSIPITEKLLLVGWNSTAVPQLHGKGSWKQEVKMNSVFNTGLTGIRDKDCEMCMGLLTPEQVTLALQLLGWLYNQDLGLQLQPDNWSQNMAGDILNTHKMLSGPPRRTRYVSWDLPPLPEFSFSFSSVWWSIFSSSNTASVTLSPTLTDSLAKLNLFLLYFSWYCL